MSGNISNLFLKPKHGAPMQEVHQVTAVDGMGLNGDTSFGRKKRQVLLIEGETLSEFGLKPGQLRENMTVQGLALAGLEPGSNILAGQVLLEVTGDCAPCQQVEDIRSGLRQEMEGRRGTLCRVVTGGELKIGDQVAIL